MSSQNSMLVDEEQDTFDNMLKGQDIQLMSADEKGTMACLDKRKIRHRAFIICHSNIQESTCFFKIGDKIMNSSTKNDDSFIRVFIDRRNKDNIKLLINDNGDLVKCSQKNISKGKKERVVLFLEDEYFAQLIIVDESIPTKVNYMISKNSMGMDALRGIAQSIVGLMMPDFNILRLLNEELNHGEDHDEK